MNFFKNLFGNKKTSDKEEGAEEKTAQVEPKKEEAGAGCDCTGCPSSGEGCPGEEMKEAVKEEEK